MTLTKLSIAPGIKRTSTAYAASGRWYDGDKVRFKDGLPEKIGGWDKLLASAFTGKCRGLLAWRDNSDNRRIGIGTHKKLYYYYAGTFTDIQPLRSSGSLTNPFDTTNASDLVQVSHAAHGATDGAYVYFSGATAVGGITISGEYTIYQVTGANTYLIQHTSAATSTANGGGTVGYEYEINGGLDDSVEAFGYGVGTYGSGTYGTARSSSITLHSRTWMLDTWGQNLIATHRNGSIYEFNPSVGGRAAIIANAPTNCAGAFVTDERIVMALGAGGDRMRVEWCDQENNTLWTPASDNQAGGYSLTGGNELLFGARLKDGVNIIWSDTDCFALQYTGDQRVYSRRRLGENNGLYGPNAAAVTDGTAFWMADGRFLMFDGFIRTIPNSLDIQDYVFGDLNQEQRDKIFAGVNPTFNEVWWHYPSAAATEVDRYVVFNYMEGSWYFGTMERTAWMPATIFGFPVATDGSGYLYKHETGVNADGAAMQAYIKSAPSDIEDGDVSMDIHGIIPDFDDLTGSLVIYLFTKDKPNDSETQEGPYTITGSTTREDTRANGRQAAVYMESNEIGGHFRLGAVRLDVQPSGGSRE